FLIGVEFEKALLPRIEANLPDLTVVATQEGVDYRTLEAHDHEEDEHEEDEHEEDEHEEDEAGGRDPHVWLSPENGKIIAGNMRDALVEAAPEHREVFESNYRDLAERIDRLDRELSETLRPLRGSTLFVFHPAFGYFSDAYGLEQEAIETGGKEPSARELVGIIERAKEEGVKVVFVQPQFSMRAAETAAEAIGGAVVPIDPLSENWFENMRGIGNTVRAELTEAQ
ncbi:MAG: metal ABC transporter solute-binding protein, Zn/Mn family, partial [Spirochaetia bacterium]